MGHSVSITVNGTSHTSEVEPRLLLVSYLREVLDLTGTHVGCDTTNCGACTVILNGSAVKSCTLFAVQADGERSRPSRGWRRTGSSILFKRDSGRSMASSAASALRE